MLNLAPSQAYIIMLFKKYAVKTASVLAFLLFCYILWLEYDYFDILTFAFTLLMSGAFFFTLLFLSSRIVFSTIFVVIFTAAIEWSSRNKFEITNFGLHLEDLYFYLFSVDNLKFLYGHFFIYLIQIGCLFIALAIIGWLLWRADFTRIKRQYAFLALIFCLSPLFIVPSFLKAVTFNNLMYSGFYNRHLATFYVSLLESHKQNIAANTRFAKLNVTQKTYVPFTAKVENPPHIIFIHQESVFPPSVFPTLKYDKSIDEFFKSFDGQTHKMRVEIFAGTSWITEFSIQSGLSALDYGTKRQFVFSLTAGKLKEALPQSLKQMGYATNHFFPMHRSFADYDNFYSSIGMDKIVDLEDMGVNNSFMRDSFFYEHGLKGMAEHFKTSTAPLYSYIQTMSPHSPYDFVFDSDSKTPAIDPSVPREMGEYLRRLYLAHQDYKAFKANLTSKFPDKSFLIVHYGDHHPVVSRPYVREENLKLKGRQDINTQTNSKGMETYYAIEGLNYNPPPLPQHDIIDAAFLGTVILEAAGLPLSPLKTQHRALLNECEGRLYSCKNQNAVDNFYKSYLESGAIVP